MSHYIIIQSKLSIDSSKINLVTPYVCHTSFDNNQESDFFNLATLFVKLDTASGQEDICALPPVPGPCTTASMQR